MTYKEVIEYIDNNVCYKQEQCLDGICKHTEQNPCAIYMANEACEKQISKKPSQDSFSEYLVFPICPDCGNGLDEDEKAPFCPQCGKAMDW